MGAMTDRLDIDRLAGIAGRSTARERRQVEAIVARMPPEKRAEYLTPLVEEQAALDELVTLARAALAGDGGGA